jgi:osmotically-inducible protein OsmY
MRSKQTISLSLALGLALAGAGAAGCDRRDTRSDNPQVASAPRDPYEMAAADEELADRIEDRLGSYDALDGVDVEPTAGGVTLRGNVPSEGDRETALSLARQLAGTRSVTDELAIAVD